jgi:cyanophycinase-like exopeptidase
MPVPITLPVNPGLVVLFGSGETSLAGGRVFEAVVRRLTGALRVSVLETPAGFQPNSAHVAGEVADFLKRRLQNYQPEVTIVPARKKNTAYSPDDAELLRPLLQANLIFLGPGSPSYAVRQLEDSLAWHMLRARHRLGAAIALASAATIAASAKALPVYEIYKVGEDLHWLSGLNFFDDYGLDPVFIPHWDNSEGGAELDTSHCFMGQDRYKRLVAQLPPDLTIVGIDEHTALVIDLAAGNGEVLGRGGVTVVKDGREQRWATGETMPLSALGPFRCPAPAAGIPEAVWQETVLAAAASELRASAAPVEVLALSEARHAARLGRDWARADDLRRQIAALGWRVVDTPGGSRVEPL